jgi:FtsP/CotA-like multicopper oxidase with cupredoxin domain
LGLAGVTAASAVLPRALLRPRSVVEAAAGLPQAAVGERHLRFVASDGWIKLPGANSPYHPDDMAPDLLTTYVFGFRDVTGFNEDQILAQKMKMQHIAPIWWLRQEEDTYLRLGNLGLEIRPDLIDAHTLHFHGFRNAIPIFDGEPHSSVGVPIARELVYFYRPHDPGTYLYHCHFEETEHVHMGMTGAVFVRPYQDHSPPAGLPVARLEGNTDPAAPLGYTYNDGDGTTAFDREFVMCLTDIWTLAHWCDSHVQLPEWSDYNPDYYLLNGRVWPDTIEPAGGGPDLAGDGDLIPPPGRPDLRYQPVSSLVQCEAGERVLLRLVNMAFIEQTMRLGGIKMRVVGRDATLLRGRDGTDLSYETDSVLIGAGESADAIFIAPDVDVETTFLLHSRNYAHLSNGGGAGYGGQMTEVRVFPAGTDLPAQTVPNT